VIIRDSRFKLFRIHCFDRSNVIFFSSRKKKVLGPDLLTAVASADPHFAVTKLLSEFTKDTQ